MLHMCRVLVSILFQAVLLPRLIKSIDLFHNGIGFFLNWNEEEITFEKLISSIGILLKRKHKVIKVGSVEKESYLIFLLMKPGPDWGSQQSLWTFVLVFVSGSFCGTETHWKFQRKDSETCLKSRRTYSCPQV